MRLKFVFISILLAVLSSSSYAQFKAPVYAVRGLHQAWLRYNVYVNTFDSAEVFATFGEFSYSSGGVRKLAPFVYSTADRHVDGSQGVGKDTTLEKEGLTSSFLIPDTTVEFSFFRWLIAQAIPGSHHHYHDTLTGTSYDRDWNIGQGKVLDSMLFKIVVMNSATGAQIACLDSVLIKSNPSTSHVQRDGTNPDSIYNTVTVNGLTPGTLVKLKIIPYRWGSTSYGMVFNQYPMWVNQSALMANDTGRVVNLDVDSAETLLGLFYDDICNYYDSCLTYTSSLPNKLIVYLPPHHEEDYHTRYFDEVTTSGMVAYMPKYPTTYMEKGSPDDKYTEISRPTTNFTDIANIFPCDGKTHDEVTVVMKSNRPPFRGSFDFVDLKGGVSSGAVWSGLITPGELHIKIPVTNVDNTVHILRLRTSDNRVVAAKKFLK